MAVKRVLAHSAVSNVKKVSAEGAVRAMADKAHYHGCRGCRRTFRCSCDTPLENPECRGCRGLVLAVWDVWSAPIACCAGNCVQVVSADDIERYRLAGPGPWFRCPTCFRHHTRPIPATP